MKKNSVIEFKSRQDEIDGFYTLLTEKTPIVSAGEKNRFIINSDQSKLLKSKRINYSIISKT